MRRYGTQVSFKNYLEQWCVGTRPGTFLTALRKAKNHSSDGKTPDVFDRPSFNQWKAAYLSNARQIAREKQRFYELQQRNGHADKRGNARQRFPRAQRQLSLKQKRGDRPSNDTRKTNPKAGNLNRDGPGYNK